MSACDDRRHLAAGAGAPADPGASDGDLAAMGEMAEAVAAFVDDLVVDGEDGAEQGGGPGGGAVRQDPDRPGHRAVPPR